MIKRTQSYSPQVNLLDFIDLVDDKEEISTFQQFKDWANNFDFMENQIMVKNNTEISHHVRFQKTPRRSTSIEMDIMNEDNNQPNTELNAYSRPRPPKFKHQDSLKISTNSYLKDGLTITYDLHSDVKENDDSIKHSSARSSRSFNGYEQINQYEIRQNIGNGAFSVVHLAKDVNTQKQYAIKILTKKTFRRKLMRKKSQIIIDNYMNNQIALLKKMKHPHITRLYEVMKDEQNQKLYLVLQYCSNGYINELRLKKSNLSFSRTLPYRKLLQSQCKRYMKQITSALDFIHNIAKIAHRDIKPENILLSATDEVKISDFGLGTSDIQAGSTSGTRQYMAPQIINKEPGQKINNQAADIWAIGITIIVLLTGKPHEPKQGQTDQKQYIQILKDISQDCKNFISRCLQVDFEKRMTAIQMLTHPWLNLDPKINDVNEKPEVSEEDRENAIVILKEIVKQHL